MEVTIATVFTVRTCESTASFSRCGLNSGTNVSPKFLNIPCESQRGEVPADKYYNVRTMCSQAFSSEHFVAGSTVPLH